MRPQCQPVLHAVHASCWLQYLQANPGLPYGRCFHCRALQTGASVDPPGPPQPPLRSALPPPPELEGGQPRNSQPHELQTLPAPSAPADFAPEPAHEPVAQSLTQPAGTGQQRLTASASDHANQACNPQPSSHGLQAVSAPSTLARLVPEPFREAAAQSLIQSVDAGQQRSARRDPTVGWDPEAEAPWGPLALHAQPDFSFCDSQVANNCAVHACNNLVMGRVTTPEIFQQLRRGLPPDAVVLEYGAEAGVFLPHAVEAEDRAHDSRGNFTLLHISAFFMSAYGATLRPLGWIDADQRTFDALVAIEQNPQLASLSSILCHLSQVQSSNSRPSRQGAGGHYIALRRWPTGQWFAVDSQAPHFRPILPGQNLSALVDGREGWRAQLFALTALTPHHLEALLPPGRLFPSLPTSIILGQHPANRSRPPLSPPLPLIPPPPPSSVPHASPSPTPGRTGRRLNNRAPAWHDLPAVGQWLRTNTNILNAQGRATGRLMALVIEHVLNDEGTPCARLVFNSQQWRDLSLASLRAEYEPELQRLSQVPARARRSVQETLVAMRAGTYHAPSDSDPDNPDPNEAAIHRHLTSYLQSWSTAAWAHAGLQHPGSPPPHAAATSSPRNSQPSPGGLLPRRSPRGHNPPGMQQLQPPHVPPQAPSILIPAVAPAPATSSAPSTSESQDLMDTSGYTSPEETVTSSPPGSVVMIDNSGRGGLAGWHAQGGRRPGAQRRPAAPATLQIVSHNVSGFTTAVAVHALVASWLHTGAHIICLQETWAGRPSHNGDCTTHTQMELWLHAALRASGYTDTPAVFWADNTSADLSNAGVAIIVLAGPAGTEITATQHRPHFSGRMQLLDISWANHQFTLCNSYWPCSNHQARNTFLRDTLAPAVAALPSVCLLGDFNFTINPAIDRRPPPPPISLQQEISTARAFTNLLPALTDASLALPGHPARRPHFTFWRNSSAARLDRAYLSDQLTPFLQSFTTSSTPRGDHNYITLCLAPAIPLQARGPGRRHPPSHLPDDPQAHAALQAFAQRAVQFGCSLSHAGVIAWFPIMVGQYANLARALARQQAAAVAAAAATVHATQRAAEEAVRAVEAAPMDQQPHHAIRQARIAHDRFRSMATRSAQPHAFRAASDWATTNERPSPPVTRLVRSNTKHSTIARLRHPAGHMCTANADLAHIQGSHFAGVSAAAPLTLEEQAAEDDLIAELRRQAQAGVGHEDGRVRLIPAELAEAAGDPNILVEEVIAGLRKADPHSSAGPDGLAYAFWRVGGDTWAPLLAHLFTAMCTTLTLPEGFLLGTITPIFKGGNADPTDPASYRPITVLNAIYRLFTSILAARFGKALTAAIGSEQCGFLPGRRIEDAINTLDLLASAVTYAGQHGAAVHLDIAKAFDTVRRGYLFRALQALGASHNMISFVRLLLTDTFASAHVNGVESQPFRFEAGVRQGCPLSPLVFLLSPQGLSCWLEKARQGPDGRTMGITMGRRTYVSSHLADDTTVYLSPPLQPAADTLLTALHSFRLATGQAVNVAKSGILCFGVGLPAPLPPNLAGIPVVPDLVSLGIPRSAPPLPPPALQPQPYALRGPQRPLPAAPAPRSPSATRVFTNRLQRARRLLHSVCDLPLSAMGMGQLVSSYVLSTFLYHAEFSDLTPDALEFYQGQVVAAVGRRSIPWRYLVGSPVLGGFGLLPLAQHMTARMASMASRLFAHLLRPGGLGPYGSLPPVWPHLGEHLLRSVCDRLHPAHTLLSAAFATAADVAQGLLAPAVFQLRALPPGPLTRMAMALQALQAIAPLQGPLEDDAPPVQAHDLVCTPQADPTTPRPMLRHLIWRPTPMAPNCCPTNSSTRVRSLTALLSSQALAARFHHHSSFMQAALGHAPAVPEVTAFHSAMTRVWRLPWDNRIKEVWFRAAVNSLPGAHIPLWRCPCAPAPAANPGNAHTLWACPVALALRQYIQQVLPVGSPFITQAHIWLLHNPAPAAMLPGVWEVTAVAAIHAMDYGRRRLWALTVGPGAAAARMDQETLLHAASQATILRFWLNLDTFAHLNPHGPRSWQPFFASIPPQHPFLHVQGGVLLASQPPPPINP